MNSAKHCTWYVIILSEGYLLAMLQLTEDYRFLASRDCSFARSATLWGSNQFSLCSLVQYFVILIKFYYASFDLYFSVSKYFWFIKLFQICILGKFCKHTLNAFIQIDKMFEAELSIKFYKMQLRTSLNTDKNLFIFFEHIVQLSTVGFLYNPSYSTGPWHSFVEWFECLLCNSSAFWVFGSLWSNKTRPPSEDNSYPSPFRKFSSTNFKLHYIFFKFSSLNLFVSHVWALNYGLLCAII